MQPATGVPRTFTFWFYIAVVVLVVVVWRIQHHWYDAVFLRPNTVYDVGSSGNAPSQWQQMGFQAALGANSLLTTLGTALLGALGLLLVNRGRSRARPLHQWSAVLCAASAGLSLYYGYVSLSHVSWMIQNQAFEATSSIYRSPTNAQFYALLVGAFFFADFALHNIVEEN